MARRKIVVRVVYLTLITILCAFLIYAWFAPFGTGEYRHSPNELYAVSAMNYNRGTFLLTRESYIELKLIRNADKSVVWSEEITYSDASQVPDYGDRRQKFITWLPDSSAFKVTVLEGQVKEVKVPTEK
jgi:hypothetical protein